MGIVTRKQQAIDTNGLRAVSAAPEVQSRPRSVTSASLKPFGRQPPPPTKRELWERFAADSKLLDTYRVTPQELEHLRTVVMLGSVNSSYDILLLLRQTRATVLSGLRG